MMEFETIHPASYSPLDHQIANAMDKGVLTTLNVSGGANSSIFHKGVAPVAVHTAGPVLGVGAPRAVRPSEESVPISGAGR